MMCAATLLALLLLLHAPLSVGQCNIRREVFGPNTTFALSDEPYIITNLTTSNKAPTAISPGQWSPVDTSMEATTLREKSSKDYLMRFHSDSLVSLTSSNSYSHGSCQMTLGQYITEHVESTSSTCITSSSGSICERSNQPTSSNETFYLFGNNYNGVFAEIESLYHIKGCPFCKKAGMPTFGIGGMGSGVNFHFHGPGFQEVIHGSKRWFLVRPGVDPSSYNHHPNKTVSEWLREDYNDVIAARGDDDFIYDCVIGVNEALYFPKNYMVSHTSQP